VGALALSFALMAGCSDENGEGGSGGTAGTGGMGGEGGTAACVDQVCACNEAGILAAIAEGGGPFTFDCDGPQTVVSDVRFYIDKDVILYGESNLTVQTSTRGPDVFEIKDGVNAELHGFSITGGSSGIASRGVLTVANSTLSGNRIGITSQPLLLTMINSTVSGNDVGMVVSGELRVINSTVSANNGEFCSGGTSMSLCLGGGIVFQNGEATVTSSTVSDNGGDEYASIYVGFLEPGPTNMTLTNTLVDGDCSVVGDESSITSGGHNIESPGDTCGFDTNLGDQVEVTAGQLNLGPLRDNGGPTMTHALLPGSVAIDQISEADCVDADGEPLTTDQRGEPRPETGGTLCDVGAFELQP
jgi:hypothetical protein